MLCSVFSGDVVLGGKLFMWGEKNVKISKKQTKFVIVGGEIQNLGGEISPPLKALKKTLRQTTVPLAYTCL